MFHSSTQISSGGLQIALPEEKVERLTAKLAHNGVPRIRIEA